MSTVMSWPAERCYWAVIDGQRWARPGPVPEGFVPVLAEEFPCDMEDVHPVCEPLPGGMLLVCAARKSDLDEVPVDTLSLVPESLPDFARDCRGRFELLTGAYEPRPIRRARSRRIAIGTAALLTCAGLLCLGLFRRAVAWEARAASLEDASVEIASAVEPGLPPEFLERKLQELEKRVVPEGLIPPVDAAGTAAAFLRGYPSAPASQPQAVSITPDSMTMAVVLEADPPEFLKAINPPEGWRLEEPRVNAAGTAWRVDLSFVRTPGGTP